MIKVSQCNKGDVISVCHKLAGEYVRGNLYKIGYIVSANRTHVYGRSIHTGVQVKLWRGNYCIKMEN